jgi:hypothetical protein
MSKKYKVNIFTNPLRPIYSVGLTKLHFVHYCLVENSYKSKLEIFNYKHP